MSSSTTILIAGMTCEHCVNAVTAELSGLSGVTAVEVDLHPGLATPVIITSDHELTAVAIADAVDEAGYSIAGGA
jgi:copper chaperone